MPNDSNKPPQPVVTNAPPAGKKFPCKQCGARIDFDPAAHALKCPYCNHTEKIEPSKDDVVQHDFEAYLARQSGASTVKGRAEQVTCQACGAVVLLEDKVVTDKCPYCASHLENKPQAAESMIPPECMLPFKIEKRQAIDAFSKWLKGLWFAPNALVQFANLGQMNGLYVPFWTFDSMTYTWYTGERGTNYQETEYYTEKDAQGNTQQKSRTVTKIRWTPVSGQVRHFFDDVAVCASTSLPKHYAPTLTPQELKNVEPFNPEYLSGFISERYTVGPKEGFDQAKEIMDAAIRQLCIRDIGGDHQRLHTVNTKHVGVTFKHLLLPVWLASYRFQNKSFRVIVNGQTGKVTGDRPYSWIKITILVLVILAIIGIIAGLVWFFSSQGKAAELRRDAMPVAAMVSTPLAASRSPHLASANPQAAGAHWAVSLWSANLASRVSGAPDAPFVISRNNSIASGPPMCSSASTARSERKVAPSDTNAELLSPFKISPSRRRTSSDSCDFFSSRSSGAMVWANDRSSALARSRVRKEESSNSAMSLATT